MYINVKNKSQYFV